MVKILSIHQKRYKSLNHKWLERHILQTIKFGPGILRLVVIVKWYCKEHILIIGINYPPKIYTLMQIFMNMLIISSVDYSNGSKTWVMKPCIGRVLGRFHHRVIRRLTGRKNRIEGDGVWIYLPLKDVMV